MGYKANRIIKTVENAGGIFINYSSVWSFHSTTALGTKNSNLEKDLKKAFKENPGVKKIGVKIGAIGQNGHSKTELLIFNIDNHKQENYSDDCHYTFTRRDI